jgi:hypothetical protein
MRTMMINTVIKSADGMVMVFDKMGEQIPQYQGQYQKVRALILRDAPPEARFGYFPNGGQELRLVPKEEW